MVWELFKGKYKHMPKTFMPITKTYTIRLRANRMGQSLFFDEVMKLLKIFGKSTFFEITVSNERGKHAGI